jgi:hypothetical protein
MSNRNAADDRLFRMSPNFHGQAMVAKRFFLR